MTMLGARPKLKLNALLKPRYWTAPRAGPKESYYWQSIKSVLQETPYLSIFDILETD